MIALAWVAGGCVWVGDGEWHATVEESGITYTYAILHAGDLGTDDADTGTTPYADDVDQRLGWTVAAGDGDGDGFDEVLVGAPGLGEGGAVYLLAGSLAPGAHPLGDVATSRLDGDASHPIGAGALAIGVDRPEATVGYYLVGAPTAESDACTRGPAGRVYLFAPDEPGDSGDGSLPAALDGATTTWHGHCEEELGSSLAVALGADGGTDLVAAGSPRASDELGAVWVLGDEGGDVHEDYRFVVSSLDERTRMGTSVAWGNVSDLDRGDYPDLVTGAPEAGGGKGAVFVIVPPEGGASTEGTVNVDDSPPGDGTRIIRVVGTGGGCAGGDGGFGTAVVADADYDGDGAADLAIGSPCADGDGQDAGEVYILPGPLSADAETLRLEDLLDDGGVEVFAPYYGTRAGSVLAAGDVDGDGTSDLVVGAPGDGGDCDSEGSSDPFWVGARSSGDHLDWSEPSGWADRGTSVAVATLDTFSGVDEVLLLGAPCEWDHDPPGGYWTGSDGAVFVDRWADW